MREKYNVDQEIDKVGFDNSFISGMIVAELEYGVELGHKQGLRRRTQDLDDFLSAIRMLPIADSFDMFASEKARLCLLRLLWKIILIY